MQALCGASWLLFKHEQGSQFTALHQQPFNCRISAVGCPCSIGMEGVCEWRFVDWHMKTQVMSINRFVTFVCKFLTMLEAAPVAFF